MTPPDQPNKLPASFTPPTRRLLPVLGTPLQEHALQEHPLQERRDDQAKQTTSKALRDVCDSAESLTPRKH
jgi:hypothetical protein